VITVFGSLNADLVFLAETLPRPGETVLTENVQIFPGGKGANQAIAAARAGGHVRMFGRVGNDDHGKLLLATLQAAEVDASGIGLSDRLTGIAMIAVDRAGHNQILVASGANGEVSASDLPGSALGAGQLLVLTMELPLAATEAAIGRQRAAGGRVLLNLAPARPISDKTLGAVDWLVVNEVEAGMAAGPLGLGRRPPVEIARALCHAHGFACLVTLGAEGAIAVSPQGAWSVGALEVRVVDTTGAGDAFVGGLAAALDQGLDLPRALRRAVVGASLSCTAAGAQSALPDVRAIEAAERRLPPTRVI
jgi:ribokinase